MSRLIAALAGIVMLMAVALVASSSTLQGYVETAGANIPTDDVLRDYAIGLAWAGVLGASILAWPVSTQHKKWLLGAWGVKAFVGLGLMLAYEEHYPGLDCWFYFRNAHVGLAEIPERLMQGGAGFVEGMAALQLNVAPDSFHALKMTFAMIGLVGIYLLYRAAEALLGRSSAGAFWALMLYPTVLFWSGIFGKDPLVLLGIAVYVLGVVQVSTQRSPRHLGMVLAGVALASAVRVWMGPILLLPCVLVVLARLRSVLWRWAMTAGLAVVLASLATVTMERLSIDDAEDLVQATRMVTDNFGTSNSALQRDVEVNSTWDLVARTPQGLFDTYFRPLPGDVDNLFGLLAGFENLFLLAMAGWALTRFRFAYLKNAMFYWSVLLLLTWGLAYSLVTYRDLGTAVRFKLQILPVLLGVIGFLIQRRRVYGVPAATRMMAVERAA